MPRFFFLDPDKIYVPHFTLCTPSSSSFLISSWHPHCCTSVFIFFTRSSLPSFRFSSHPSLHKFFLHLRRPTHLYHLYSPLSFDRTHRTMGRGRRRRSFYFRCISECVVQIIFWNPEILFELYNPWYMVLNALRII